MSLAGLKKQFNKANQYISEHVGTAEATKLDEDFNEMERKIDLTNELVEDLINKTREYLQPNPVTRAKMATVGYTSKISGANRNLPYPQPEGVLGESMSKYGKSLGVESYFARALTDCGEAFRQMADVKYAMEDTVKQNFLDPLYHLQSKDLKEVNHHRKKLQGRRLDYDCKKRKQVRGPNDDDMYLAEEKLEESKKLAEAAMFNVLDNDVEQISQLCALVDAQLDFHRQTTSILESLRDHLKDRMEEGSTKPKREHISKPVLAERSPRSKSPVPDTPTPQGSLIGAPTTNSHGTQDPWSTGGGSPNVQDPWGQPPPAYASVANNNAKTPMPSSQPQQPCAKAVFDFDAENEGELSFKEGQVINLSSQIDENWFEGCLPGGQAGFFPISYVQVVVPLP